MGVRLSAYIDHMGLALGVEVGEFSHGASSVQYVTNRNRGCNLCGGASSYVSALMQDGNERALAPYAKIQIQHLLPHGILNEYMVF
ncbi:hypothetical protein GCM10027276_06780 [Comamonas piscis]